MKGSAGLALSLAMLIASPGAAAPCADARFTRAVEVAARRYEDCASSKLEKAYVAMAERHPKGVAILGPTYALALCKEDGDVFDAVVAGCVTDSFVDRQQSLRLSAEISQGIIDRLRKATEMAHPESTR